jgi:hypothetical protein
MEINNEIIDKLADLAKLDFTETEKVALQKDMTQIISFFEKMNEVNTDKVEQLAIDRAKEILDSKNWKINKSSTHLKSGHLPPAQIDAQARRFAVKIFLSHFHAVWYETHHGNPAPRPYTIAHMDHVHEIEIPNYTPLPKV